MGSGGLLDPAGSPDSVESRLQSLLQLIWFPRGGSAKVIRNEVDGKQDIQSGCLTLDIFQQFAGRDLFRRAFRLLGKDQLDHLYDVMQQQTQGKLKDASERCRDHQTLKSKRLRDQVEHAFDGPTN